MLCELLRGEHKEYCRSEEPQTSAAPRSSRKRRWREVALLPGTPVAKHRDVRHRVSGQTLVACEFKAQVSHSALCPLRTKASACGPLKRMNEGFGQGCNIKLLSSLGQHRAVRSITHLADRHSDTHLACKVDNRQSRPQPHRRQLCPRPLGPRVRFQVHIGCGPCSAA